jgi:hypothetical protein
VSLLTNQTEPRGDFVATTCAVLLVVFVASNAITFESAPSVSSLAALLIAATAFGVLCPTAVLRPSKSLPLVLMITAIFALTALNHFFVESQRLDVMLRYATSIVALFGMWIAHLPDLRRIFSFIGMAVVGYAGFYAATGGPYIYAGTPRLIPFWSGVSSSSLIVAAFTIVIALTPLPKLVKAFWVVLGLVLVVGYGVVTTVLMIALFFGGWWFLRKGWNRFWLYSLGAAGVVGGIIFRDKNSVAGADIASLGVGAVGSGRVDAWLQRFQEFAERDFPSIMIGLGPYSDYQVTGLWDWEEKNAHSDLVTLLMEYGLLGLCVVLIGAFFYYKQGNQVEKLAFIAVAFGAAASNPLLDRPVIAAGWGVVLYACSYHAVVRIPRKERAKKQYSSYTPPPRTTRSPSPART